MPLWLANDDYVTGYYAVVNVMPRNVAHIFSGSGEYSPPHVPPPVRLEMHTVYQAG